MLVSNWRHVCYFWWDKLILKGSDYEIDKYVFLLAAIGSKKIWDWSWDESVCWQSTMCVETIFENDDFETWWWWFIHSFIHSNKMKSMEVGQLWGNGCIRPGETLEYERSTKVGGNIRNRLIIISWDHFNDFEDFEEDGQLDLLVVYFPLEMYIFLFDLEIFAQQRIYVYCVDIFHTNEVSHQKVKCHIS